MRTGSAPMVMLPLAAVCLIGCAAESSDDAADASGLFEPGAYDVGFRELEFSFQPVSPQEAARMVPVRVWYPADAGSTAEPATYVLGGIVELPSPSALDAPPVASDGPFPVVVYSHGSGGEGLVAYPYGELFASHGFITVAPNHVGNTALDGLSNSADPFAKIAVDRPSLVSATLDWLESDMAGDDLKGTGDTDQVLLVGHSFGGYTALASAGSKLDHHSLADACSGDECALFEEAAIEAAIRAGAADSRVAAIVPQAPALIQAFAQGELGMIEVPTLLMTGRLDQTTTFEEDGAPAWEALDGPNDLWVEMPTGAHFTFISVCDDLEPELIEIFRPGAEEDGCGPEFIPVAEAVPTLAAYTLAFARAHILGEPEWDQLIRNEPLRPGFDIFTR